MSTVDGTWNIEIATPMGVQKFTLVLNAADGALTGTATNNNGEYELREGAITESGATFIADIKKPFPLTLAFDVTANGDAISGTSKAGPFPPSKVTGVRA